MGCHPGNRPQEDQAVFRLVPKFYEVLLFVYDDTQNHNRWKTFIKQILIGGLVLRIFPLKDVTFRQEMPLVHDY